MKETMKYYANNKDELFELFKIEKRPFVLFVGAGINGGFSNMTWNDLLKGLLEKAISILVSMEGVNNINIDAIKHSFLDKKNTYFTASIIKRVLGSQYISFIQNNIYSNCNKYLIKKEIDETNSNKDNILIETAKLILLCDNIEAVVTYNYDNFLRTALDILLKNKENNSYRAIKPIDVFKTVQSLPHAINTFPIYHVHGFIPPPDRAQNVEAENVILAYDEYLNNNMEPYSWQTSAQLFYLNNKNVIFIGASLEDWNMLRALSISHKYSNAAKRFALFINQNCHQDYEVNQFINKLESGVFSEVGIKPIYTETDDYSEITNIIKDLYNNK